MRVGIALAVFATSTLLACRDKSPRPEPNPTPSNTKQAADGSVPIAVPTTVRVGLLDSGEKPRAPLRYRFSIGDKQLVVLRLRYSATNRLRAAAPKKIRFPGIKLVFHVEIVEALRGDRVRYRFDLVEAALTDVGGADKGLVATATEALKRAQGIRGSAVVDSRGIIRDGTIDIPRQLDPSIQIMLDGMRSSMEQLSTPLPEEPVGIGARWELSQTLVQGGTTLDQTTLYELVKNTDGEVELIGTIEQHAERQEVPLAGFDYAELVSLTADGKASMAVNLERLAPVSAKYALKNESRFEFAKKSGRRQALISAGDAEIGVASQ